jgi:Chromo (CHRromatin Organisation MOdifier) domain
LVDVDRIMEHVGETKGPKGELYFRVRWKGLTEKEDTWLPWRELLHNTILHEYLRKNKMASIIPHTRKSKSILSTDDLNTIPIPASSHKYYSTNKRMRK